MTNISFSCADDQTDLALPKPSFPATVETDDKINSFLGKRGALYCGKEQIFVTSPKSAFTPKRQKIAEESIAHQRPLSFIEFQREEQSAKIVCPDKWKNLSYLIYMAMSEDGQILIGRTKKFEKRLLKYSAELSRGERSLGRAWQSGQRVFIAPLYLCSSYESAKQNETSFIAAMGSKHNRNRGNGSVDLDFGSPLNGGGGGQCRELLLQHIAEEYKNFEPITDFAKAQPNRWYPIDFNQETAESRITVPYTWRSLCSAIYVFNVAGKLYIGETEHLGARLSAHLSNINSEKKKSSFATEVKEALKRGETVSIGLLGVSNPTKPANRLRIERAMILAKKTLKAEGGCNGKLDGSPKSPTSPLRGFPEDKELSQAMTIPSRKRPLYRKKLEFT